MTSIRLLLCLLLVILLPAGSLEAAVPAADSVLTEVDASASVNSRSLQPPIARHAWQDRMPRSSVKSRTWRPIYVASMRGLSVLVIVVLIATSMRRLRSDTPFESHDPPFRLGAALEILGVLIAAVAVYFGDLYGMINGLGLVLTGRFLYFGQRWAIGSSALFAVTVLAWVLASDYPPGLKAARAVVPWLLFAYIYFGLSARLGTIRAEDGSDDSLPSMPPIVSLRERARTRHGAAMPNDAASALVPSTARPEDSASSAAPTAAADPLRVQQAEAIAQRMLIEERGRTAARARQRETVKMNGTTFLASVLVGLVLAVLIDPSIGFAVALLLMMGLVLRQLRG
ncbi:hypothetical protein [Pseudomarimonas arenosa]|uniref:Uncharacterized protein n=1 Tax=Pseudomarimonas arenosa TaxID=2774145 RepID=A0AAW3ZPU4_9GAMM|nr:hypothetical protein [Pseudomarimonas arenosa]MBD8528136.1 hypothetical protein [Pseudomarimonas arenosa]